MPTADTFRNLEVVPATLDDVLWPELEPAFYQQCREGLQELTLAYQSSNQPKTSFYVGAGISVYKPSRLPVAHTVIKALFEECARLYPDLQRYSRPLEGALNRSNYVLMENIFQHLFENVHPGPFHAGQVFDIPALPPRFNINHTFLARWLHSGRGSVITPNLDPLIEHAWHNATGLNPDHLTVIRRPDDFESWSQLINQPDILWKLHGSSDDPASWAIILSRVGFSLEDARAEFIKHLVFEHNLCFIGYRAADLDLFPPIRDAHSQRRPGGSKIFWVFYFREGRKTLDDYLGDEPNIAQLFEANPECICPIVTTAERLSTWLQRQCLHTEPALPSSSVTIPTYDYRRWFVVDLQLIGAQAAQGLIGYAFRVLGDYDQALTVLDEAVEAVLKDEGRLTQANELLIRQTAQLLQESAQTSWQKKDYLTAITKVERAHKLLRKFGDDPGSEYGLVTMILDAKGSIRWTKRVSAIARLIRLHWRFWRLSNHPGPGFSPILGQGLCIFHEAKITEELIKKTPFIRFRPVRLLLIAWYGHAGNFIQKSKFLNSMPDVKRRQAFLWATLDADRAVKEMIEAIRLAQTVSDAHYQLSVERARLLSAQLDDPDAQRKLLDAIGDPPNSSVS